MYKNLLSACALTALCACGDGNPFASTGDAGDDGATVEFAIPEEVAGTVSSFVYDADAETLTLTGLLRDGDEQTVTMRRRAGLDRGVYQAYTAQDDPLDEHTTVYVRELGNVSGAVAVTGGQFTYYSGGTNFGRTGSYDPIVPSEADDRGLVTYAGEYIGLSNLNGAETDLLPAPAIDPDGGGGSSVQPSQASVIEGRVLINVEFSTNQVAGEVYDRVIYPDPTAVSSAGRTEIELGDIILVPTTMADDGTFVGDVELPGNRQDIGGYSGNIGGPDSNVLAGSLYAEEHFGSDPNVGGEEEYGIFVLGRCGSDLEDPSTECSAVDPE